MTMSTFNKEYFFLLLTDDDRIPRLSPDEDTAAKPYSYEVQPIGQKPFIFHNGALDWQQERGIIPMDPPPKVLFDGADLVVVYEIAKILRDFEIPNLAIQPAIYIDHKNNWHENYWFLTFTAEFDCWDRKHSTYDPEPMPHTNPPWYEVETYSLNDKLLRETPLAARRLFKMGNTTDGNVVAHESVADIFRVEGVDVLPIEDYGVVRI
jgi:hypothetical protein